MALVLVLVAVLLPATGASGQLNAAPASTRYLDEIFVDVAKTSDVVYGSAPNYDGSTETLQLDLYQPVGDAEANRPAIVYIHGGSFQSGDKSEGDSWLRLAAKRGYVGISVNYRLVPGALADLTKLSWAMPAAQHDTQAAIRWLRENATNFGVNPSAIAAVGYSAGALTSMHTAFMSAEIGDSGNPGYASDVTAAVALAGAAVRITPDAPPELMFHGTADPTVPYSWGEQTCASSVAAGNECTLVTYPGGTHNLSPFLADIRTRTWQFLFDEVVPALTPVPPSATYHPVDPYRVLDTRDTATPIGAGGTVDVDVTGLGGVPASGVTGVVVNVTGEQPTAPTHITAWAAGTPLPATSNLNLRAGETRAVLVTAQVGPAGSISLRNNSGQVHLVADVVGWYDDGTVVGARFLPVGPVRALDTRDGTGGTLGPLGPGAVTTLQVAGLHGVPADAKAVVLNVTAVSPSASTHLTIWPSGAMPLSSSLNAPPGANVANLVVAKVAPDGTVRIFNNAGATHVVADITGSFAAEGTRFVPVAPLRALDTRDGTGTPTGPVGPGGVVELRIRGLAGLPEHGVSAVVLSVAVVGASQATHVTVWPTGAAIPSSSNLNAATGDTNANLYLGAVGGGGDVSLRNNSGGVHLVADVVGYLI